MKTVENRRRVGVTAALTFRFEPGPEEGQQTSDFGPRGGGVYPWF